MRLGEVALGQVWKVRQPVWVACVATVIIFAGASAVLAGDLKLNAPARSGEVRLKTSDEQVDVHTEGWACSNRSIDDKTAFDHADMADLTERFRLFETQLKGLVGMKRKFSEDRTLAEETVGAVADNSFVEGYSRAKRDGAILVSKYGGDEAITPRDAASLYGLTLVAKGASGRIVGGSGSHPFLLQKYAGVAPGSLEFEFGHCYEVDDILQSVATMRTLAKSLTDAMEDADAQRSSTLQREAGS